MEKMAYLLIFIFLVSGCATLKPVNLSTLSNDELANYYYQTLSQLEYYQSQNYEPPPTYEIQYHKDPFSRGAYRSDATIRQKTSSDSTSAIMGSFNRGRIRGLQETLIAIRAEMYRREMKPPY